MSSRSISFFITHLIPPLVVRVGEEVCEEEDLAEVVCPERKVPEHLPEPVEYGLGGVVGFDAAKAN